MELYWDILTFLEQMQHNQQCINNIIVKMVDHRLISMQAFNLRCNKQQQSCIVVVAMVASDRIPKDVILFFP